MAVLIFALAAAAVGYWHRCAVAYLDSIDR